MKNHVSAVAEGSTLSLAAVWDMQKLGSSKLIDDALKNKLIQLGVKQSFSTTTAFAFEMSEVLEVFESEDEYSEGEYGSEPAPLNGGAVGKGADILSLLMKGASCRV